LSKNTKKSIKDKELKQVKLHDKLEKKREGEIEKRIYRF
jgi:hypothetical protein